MAHKLFTIKKRSTFLMIRNEGKFIKGRNINLQILYNQDLDNSIGLGFTASKKIGNAIKRNKIKRRLKNIANDAVKKISIKFEYSYLVISKPTMLNSEFKDIKETLFQEFKKIR